MLVEKPKSTVLAAELQAQLFYHSLERVQGKDITPETWAHLAELSRQRSPASDPTWWLDLLVLWRRRHPALPRAYFHSQFELTQELQLKSRYEQGLRWGSVSICKKGKTGQANLLGIYGATWELLVTADPQRISALEVLGLLHINGYRIPAVRPLKYPYVRLPKLLFRVELWVGEPPEVSAFSVARFLDHHGRK